MGFGCAERLPRFTTAPETKLLLLAVSTRRFDCVFSTSALDEEEVIIVQPASIPLALSLGSDGRRGGAAVRIFQLRRNDISSRRVVVVATQTP
jgi:hypothetical protein